MTDNFTRLQRSAIMRCVKSQNTKPEMIVRRAIHSAGFRYRLHSDKLPGKPDLIFPQFKIALFVHGCFWHWHGCKRSRMPKTNKDYWERKIKGNVERDNHSKQALTDKGWKYYIIWECEIVDSLADILEILRRERNLKQAQK